MTMSGATDRTGRRLRHLPRMLVAASVLWVVAAALSLFFLPVVVEETHTISSGSDMATVTRSTRPLFSADPWVEAVVLAVGSAAAVGTILWARRQGALPRPALVIAGWVTFVFCLITGFSIGIFFIPAPLLLFAAAATTPPPAGSGA